jgi:hypothetical protein
LPRADQPRYIRFICGPDGALTRVRRVSRYASFEQLLNTEDPEKVTPAGIRDQQLASICRIYGPERKPSASWPSK